VRICWDCWSGRMGWHSDSLTECGRVLVGNGDWMMGKDLGEDLREKMC
jgi:hypothetical protein